jgi:hypothetical protein
MDLNDHLWLLELDCFGENESDQRAEDENNPYEGLVMQIPSDPSQIPPGSDIVILIQELNERGILHPIGGELWEASLILCSLILRNMSYLTESSILELGSGVGLPSILLIILKLRSLSEKGGDCGSIYLTDYDEEVLENLKSIITKQFPGNYFLNETTTEGKQGQGQVTSTLSVYLQKLDWNDFLVEDEGEEAHRVLPLADTSRDRRSLPLCQVMIGSELIYTSTQQGLSSLILSVPILPSLISLTSPSLPDLTDTHWRIAVVRK